MCCGRDKKKKVKTASLYVSAMCVNCFEALLYNGKYYPVHEGAARVPREAVEAWVSQGHEMIVNESSPAPV